jgi:hypothetical protein
MTIITAGGKKYTLYSFTGKVTGMGKDQIIYTLSQNVKSFPPKKTKWIPPVRVETATKSFDHIFLTAGNGAEHSFTLKDINIACREGHQLTVIWVVRKGKERGPHIAIENNTTFQTFFSSREITRIFRVPVLFPILLPAIFCLAGFLLYHEKGALLAVVPGIFTAIISGRSLSRIAAKRFMTTFRVEAQIISEPMQKINAG